VFREVHFFFQHVFHLWHFCVVGVSTFHFFPGLWQTSICQLRAILLL
jgi:hypothetical protein